MSTIKNNNIHFQPHQDEITHKGKNACGVSEAKFISANPREVTCVKCQCSFMFQIALRQVKAAG